MQRDAVNAMELRFDGTPGYSREVGWQEASLSLSDAMTVF